MLFSRQGKYDFLIFALGNPGREYEHTRHNIGFLFADRTAEKLGIKIKHSKFNALYGEISLSGKKGLIVKPQTYMNSSGEAVYGFSGAYGVPAERIFVVLDDINLPLYEMRIRKKGSSGGHNGLKSIEKCLKSQDFPRIRVGVGAKQSEEQDLKDFVLSDFTKAQLKEYEPVFDGILEALELCIADEYDKAMAKFNVKAKSRK